MWKYIQSTYTINFEYKFDIYPDHRNQDEYSSIYNFDSILDL